MHWIKKRFMMKVLLVIIAILILVFLLTQLFALKSQWNIETHPYTVLKKEMEFEIRSYESALYTTVKLPGNKYKKMSSQGFSLLASYIFGGNDRNEKIAMTSPVIITLEDSMTMKFLVPKKYNLETLPEPKQSQIIFEKEAEKTMAAISFGGWANETKIEMYTQKLQSALYSKGIAHKDLFYFLGYNAPYEMFNRKNEIVVELLHYDKSTK